MGRSDAGGGRWPRAASAWAALYRLVQAVGAADADAIDAAARQLGGSRRYLAPLGWAAGTITLMLTGVKLLIFNWRLTLLQLVPAVWVWLAMWDLKQHFLHGRSLRQLDLLALIGVGTAVVLLTILALWCNTVFAFAIDGPRPPKIAPAIRKASSERSAVLGWGLAIGGALAIATVVVPRLGRLWLFGLILGSVLAVMLIAFVAVPARLIGVTPPKNLTLKQRVGRAGAGAVLSAVAMGPGYLLDRLGLIMLGIPGLKLIGLMVLSIGVALYAAGSSAVRAVKLSSKLIGPPTEAAQETA